MPKQTVPATNLGLLFIREDLANKVEMLLEDPRRPGKRKYGALRVYLEKLIAKDMAERNAIARDVLNDILGTEE